MPPENATVCMNDVAGNGSARHQPLDHLRVMSRRHEADVLAVGLLGIRQAKLTRQFAHPRFRHASQREPQARELRARCREQEVALVALGVGRPVKRPPAASVVTADNVVASRQQIGAKVIGGVEQISEFHVLIAGDARHRSFAGDIGSREWLDHLLAKALLVVEHIMGNAEPRRDIARIMNILPCAARALAVCRFAMVIELHRDADDVIAFGGQQRRHDRQIDPARHRDDDTGLGGGLIKP